MQIEEITNKLNDFLNYKRKELNLNIKDKFIVKRNIFTMKPPIFKKFTIELFYTPIGDKINPIKIIYIQNIIKCPVGEEHNQWEYMNNEYTLKLFEFIRTVEFDNILYGNNNKNK